jgi:hypothetical protein
MATYATSQPLVHLFPLETDADPLASLRNEFEVEVPSHAFGSFTLI